MLGDAVVCKVCGKKMPISNFYTYIGYTRGVAYLKVHKTCKKCKSILRLQKLNKEEPIVEKYLKEIVVEPPRRSNWILRNLREHGNCYIREKSSVDVEQLSLMLGKEITVRQEVDGCILEIKKPHRTSIY